MGRKKYSESFDDDDDLYSKDEYDEYYGEFVEEIEEDLLEDEIDDYSIIDEEKLIDDIREIIYCKGNYDDLIHFIGKYKKNPNINVLTYISKYIDNEKDFDNEE